MPLPGFDAVGRPVVGQISEPSGTPPMSWFVPLSEPVQRPRFKAGEQQAFVAPPFPPIVPHDWFVPLSEPVRKKPGLNPGQVQSFAIDTDVIPVSRINWFMPLSEPVRQLQGLNAARQQFLAAPSRLLPNPNIMGTLTAVEQGDLFTGGGRLWNRVVTGEAGIIEQNLAGAEIGASVTLPSVGASSIIEPIAVPVSGAAVPTISRAIISIRII